MNKSRFYIIYIFFSLLTFGINKFSFSYESYVKEYAERVSVIEQRKEKISEFSDSIAECYKQLKTFRRNLPLQSMMSELAKDIVNQSKYYGVNVSNIDYEPFEKVTDKIYKLKFSMPVSGNYSNIRQFIYRMETLRKVITIEGISSLRSIKDNEQVTIKLSFSAYFEEDK